MIETVDGQLRIHMEILPSESSPEIVSRLQQAIAGLAHVYRNDSMNIEALGEAYTQGWAMAASTMKSDKDGEEKLVMGFFS